MIKIKILSRILKLLKKLLIFIIFVVAFYFVSALVFSLLKTHPSEFSCTVKKQIFITTNGVHLDIVLPVENIQPEFLEKLEVLKGTKYVSFGWGDKEFYINTPEWSDLTLPTAFKALFLKSETAMHVTCCRNSNQSWNKLFLCESQIDLLNKYIENSFLKTGNGKLIKLNVDGYNNYDSFFEAKGNFSFYKTCNIWVNQALKEIEVKTSVWSPFDFGILYHLQE
ncbi:MAG: DUF2459 domain-containing protein [Prolixibacteraceae bacterium]|nr:DUF2459 domain-containing protein [Prolixibacteraceae bacterium]MBT6765170.1 DUF2459 domain-containing protein [Prolixibacteraceae bacterium]MBT7001009.1 DUF2459 domain-containing protein [Prolixibacteraceae bacterium]MBT7393703.1 DUF2459 domain-containing protein [Prolixibacteraceae bacterium]